MKAITTVIFMLLSGCILAGCAPMDVRTASVDELCLSDTYEARVELRRRNAISMEELRLAVANRIAIGMSRLGVLCGWGRPSEINRTVTEHGASEQWVYEKYLGRTTGSLFRFVYIENEKVIAFQE